MNRFCPKFPYEETRPFDPTGSDADLLRLYFPNDLVNLTCEYLSHPTRVKLWVNIFLMSTITPRTVTNRYFLEEHHHLVLSYWGPDRLKMVRYDLSLHIVDTIYFPQPDTLLFLREFGRALKVVYPPPNLYKQVLFQYFQTDENYHEILTDQRVINHWVVETIKHPSHQLSPSFFDYLISNSYTPPTVREVLDNVPPNEEDYVAFYTTSLDDLIQT